MDYQIVKKWNMSNVIIHRIRLLSNEIVDCILFYYKITYLDESVFSKFVSLIVIAINREPVIILEENRFLIWLMRACPGWRFEF